MFGLLFHFGRSGSRLTFGRKTEGKIKVNLGWLHFLCDMRKDFLMNKIRLFWCFVTSITWGNGEKTVLQMYLFKTQTIGFQMIKVRGFWGEFYPKVFKGTNWARLKNMLVCHYPGLFFHVRSASRGFFSIILRWKRKH